MATRRSAATKKDDVSAPVVPAQSSAANTRSRFPSPVIIKLILVTIATICAPLGTYYGTLNTICEGDSTYAGGLAAISVNLVLIIYLIIAAREDTGETEEERRERERKEE
ncbi:vacuolar ATPase assembly integral membrane protein VMA21 [Blastomyces percursus]|uniref:Vacuolar ATPase assembly integral membrane protein VMA21 n=1 Tax=Blastomyces percursus TaxID=1658174 RepID=A0A1J9R6K3_9EURO|nr:vacuolar ATPase assembly integral membrane protein VMA21 [Blastomyces percursus]